MRSPLRFRATVALPGRVDLVVEEVEGQPPEVRIVAVDPSERKRVLAAKLGATDFVDPTLAPAAAQVLDLTAGRGVDVAVEAYGSAATIEQALAATGRGGICIQVGTPRLGEQVRIPPGTGERVFVSSVYGSGDVRRDIPRPVDLAEAERIVLTSLVSKCVPLMPGPLSPELRAPDPDVLRTVMQPNLNISVLRPKRPEGNIGGPVGILT